MHSTSNDDETTINPVTETSTHLFQSSIAYIAGLLDLAQLELKYNIHSIFRSFALILIATILAMSGWLVFLFGLSIVLHDYGLSWGLILLSVLGLNFLLLFVCLIAARNLASSIGFSRTAGQIKSL